MSDSEGKNHEELKTVVIVEAAKDEPDSDPDDRDAEKNNASARASKVGFKAGASKRELTEEQKKAFKMRRPATMSKDLWKNVKEKDLYPIQCR